MIEEVAAFEFTYRPFDSRFPIRSCVMTIYAKDRKEAELIALTNNYKFFNESCTCSVREFSGGYRQVIKQND
jgi:hypothetical protein